MKNKLIALSISFSILLSPFVVLAIIGGGGSIGGTQFLTIDGTNNYNGVATSTSIYAPTNYVWGLGTTSTAYPVGLSRLSIYGTTTIQTPVNTIYALRVLNAASTSVFTVPTTATAITIVNGFI